MTDKQPAATVKFYDMPDGTVMTEVDMCGEYRVTAAQKLALRYDGHFSAPLYSKSQLTDTSCANLDGLKKIYKHNKPYGIRDSSGFLLFFTDITKYQGQEERYRLEVEQQYKLADYLLLALKAGKQKSNET